MLRDYVDEYRINTNKILTKKDSTNQFLRKENERLKSNNFEVMEFAAEAKTVFPTLTEFSLSDNILVATGEEAKVDTVIMVYTKFSKKPLRAEREKLTNWIKVKTNREKVKLMVD